MLGPTLMFFEQIIASIKDLDDGVILVDFVTICLPIMKLGIFGCVRKFKEITFISNIIN